MYMYQSSLGQFKSPVVPLEHLLTLQNTKFKKYVLLTLQLLYISTMLVYADYGNYEIVSMLRIALNMNEWLIVLVMWGICENIVDYELQKWERDTETEIDQETEREDKVYLWWIVHQ